MLDSKPYSKEKFLKTPPKFKGLCKGAFRTSPQQHWKQRVQVQGASQTAKKFKARAKKTAANTASQEEELTSKCNKLDVNSDDAIISSHSMEEAVQ